MKNKIISVLIGLVLMTVVLVSLYYYEYNAAQPHTYYGDITTKEVFEYPENVKSIAFGKNAEGGVPLLFFNSLYCRPLNNQDADYQVVFNNGYDIEYKHFDLFVEIEPALVSRKPNSRGFGMVRYISENSEEMLRSDESKFLKYGSWDAGKPLENSRCYISTRTLYKTPIFGIDKTQDTESNKFDYLYGE